MATTEVHRLDLIHGATQVQALARFHVTGSKLEVEYLSKSFKDDAEMGVAVRLTDGKRLTPSDGVPFLDGLRLMLETRSRMRLVRES